MNLKIINSHCLEYMRTMPKNSIDSIVTDPPYGLSFMGKKWDYDIPSVEIWRECLRVLKPGGHLLSFAGTRTQHRMAMNIEDAGFEIRDMIAWVYGSGFPKSLDVSKAIDKRRHDGADIRRVTAWVAATRTAAGVTNRDIDAAFGFNGMAGHWTTQGPQAAIPTLDQVPRLLDVLGVDPDDVPDDIRRLLLDLNDRKGQPGENWLKREVVGTASVPVGHAFAGSTYGGDSSGITVDITAPATPDDERWQGWGTALKPALEPITLARKPLAGTVAENVLAHGAGALNINGCRLGGEADRWPANFIHDGSEEVIGLFGTAVRFFYCAKASKKDRDEGLEECQEVSAGVRTGRKDGSVGINAYAGATSSARNFHPTVKPTNLMRYLCRLITPPKGTILDPFMGSGSTGKAAKMEGFSFVGVEREKEYCEIAKKRIESVCLKQLKN